VQPEQIPGLDRLKRSAGVLTDAGWFLPAYIRLGLVHRLADAIETASEANKARVLEEGVLSLYGHRELAPMLLERYRKWPYIRDFADTIAEAIEAAAYGLTRAATAALVPVVEGVITKVAADNKVEKSQNNGGRRILDTLEAIERIGAGRWNPAGFLEVKVMIESYRTFFMERFWQQTESLAATEHLNRHGILHGILPGSDFGRPYNFARLISVLDLLCFLICVAGPRDGTRMSALAPDETADSIALATYFSSIAAVRIHLVGRLPADARP
jgi:hypothetical protein